MAPGTLPYSSYIHALSLVVIILRGNISQIENVRYGYILTRARLKVQFLGFAHSNIQQSPCYYCSTVAAMNYFLVSPRIPQFLYV